MTVRNFKKFILPLAAIAFLLMIVFFSAWQKNDQSIDTNTADGSVSETRNIIVNDIGFKIPKRLYNQQAIPVNNTSDVNFLLEAELPKVTQLQKDYNDYLGKGRTVIFKPTSILVSTPLTPGHTPVKNLAERLKYQIKFNGASKNMGMLHGLRYLIRPDGKINGSTDVLYEGGLDKPDTIIHCNEEDEKVFPGCRMQFYYKGLFVKVSFRRADWLPQWKEIKQNTLKRLEEFHQAYLKENQSSK